MRARVYWPVTIAAAALVGLLAYGLTTTGTDTTSGRSMTVEMATHAAPSR